MYVILIKYKDKYEEVEEIVGVAANSDIAYKHIKNLKINFPHAYGDSYGRFSLEQCKVIEE